MSRNSRNSHRPRRSRGWQANPGSSSRRGGRGRGNGKQGFDPTQLVQKAVQYQPDEPYVTQHRFQDFDLSGQIKTNVHQKGYTIPTPIQDQAIPVLLQGKDVVGIANTGTGKTAAFLLPLIHKVLQDPQNRVLIIAPTRELALQIEQEFRDFAKSLNIYATLCIGGASINRQSSQLRRDPHFVIGTPGRLKDLNQRKYLDFRQFNNIVLDEVDQMMDMGFIHDMKFIISRLSTPRQSVFFSATLPDSVRGIMDSFLTDPVTIRIKSTPTAANVQQDVIKTAGKQKVEVLHDLLIQQEYQKVLVFGRTKWGMEKLYQSLEKRGFKAAAIHGNKSQGQRQRALTQFKKSEIQVLLATDVAARGLDIDDVTHVINYDMPQDQETYIHRIGRTGRASKTGKALTFID